MCFFFFFFLTAQEPSIPVLRVSTGFSSHLSRPTKTITLHHIDYSGPLPNFRI